MVGKEKEIMEKYIWLVKKNYIKFEKNTSSRENKYFEAFKDFKEAYEKFMEFHKEENQSWYDYLDDEGIEANIAIENYVNKIDIVANENGKIIQLLSYAETETVDHEWIELRRIEV